jgi:hypothetical protein
MASAGCNIAVDERIAPLPIEEYLKSVLAGVSNAVVVGDRRRFLAVLLWLKVQRTAAHQPRDVRSLLIRVAAPALTLRCGPHAAAAGTGCTRMLAARGYHCRSKLAITARTQIG